MLALTVAQAVNAQNADSQANEPVARVGQELRISLTRAPDNVDIDLDGRLNDAVWNTATSYGGMGTVEPETLLPSPYDTQIKTFYTDDGIYIGVEMEQPSETLIRRITGRDNRNVNRDIELC